MGIYGIPQEARGPISSQVEAQMSLVRGVLEAHASGASYADLTRLRTRAERFLGQEQLSGAYAEIACFLAIARDYNARMSTEEEDRGGVDIWVDTEEKDSSGASVLWAIQVKSNVNTRSVSVKKLAEDSPEGLRMLRTAAKSPNLPERRVVIPVWVEVPGGEKAEMYNMMTGKPTEELSRQLGSKLVEVLWE